MSDKFKYRVVLDVEIEALDDGMAFDILQDVFGVGEQDGVYVSQCEYREKRK